LDPLSSTSDPGLIRLFCLRHGERVDFAFGPSWPELAFDKTGISSFFFFRTFLFFPGNYRRINLNMPISLPHRRNPYRDFIGDSPITEIGASQARLTGEALAVNDCFAQYCYSSPSLRCLQTAHYILQGMGIEDRVKIRIEPGLFEFLGWYERGLPSFFNPSEMIVDADEEINLFNIDKNYRPIISLEKLSRDEKYIDYYNRSYKVTQQITDKHKLTGKEY
jgi:ubiquitin-associated SH3 domain-containing protein